MEEKKPFGVVISKALLDPDEKKAWAHSMMRIQLAMYVDDKATCEQCGYTYKSVDDFIRCNPRGGAKKLTYVCSGCWNDYKKEHGEVLVGT